MIPISYKRLVYLRNYIISVVVAAVVLVALRWDSTHGVPEMLDMVSECIWQAIVWPLYLIRLIMTP